MGHIIKIKGTRKIFVSSEYSSIVNIEWGFKLTLYLQPEGTFWQQRDVFGNIVGEANFGMFFAIWGMLFRIALLTMLAMLLRISSGGRDSLLTMLVIAFSSSTGMVGGLEAMLGMVFRVLSGGRVALLLTMLVI